MRSGDIETLTIPCTPLDVLAQQTVAAAAMDDLKPDDWYVTVRKAAPFEDLDRTMFDAVMGMMTGAYNNTTKRRVSSPRALALNDWP